MEGELTRQRVIAAAARLFAAQGYAATGIAQIASESSTLPNSIYWAFTSKEGLLLAVLEHLAEQFYRERAAAQPRSLRDVLDDLRASTESRPEFLRLQFMLALERREGDPRVIEAARRHRERGVHGLGEVLGNLIDAGAPIGDEARLRIGRTLAQQIMMFVGGALVARQIDGDAADLTRAFDLQLTAIEASMHALVDAECAHQGGASARAVPAKRRAAAARSHRT